MGYDVIAMGSATVDVFCNSDSELISIRTRKDEEELIAYPVGSKIIITDLNFEVGGGGTNSAVAFKRLGFETAYLGCLGNDDCRLNIVNYLNKQGIKFIGTVEKCKTNYSVILDSICDDRTILSFRESSDRLKFSKVNKKELDTKWIYSASQAGESRKTFVKICKHVKKKGTKICYNPGTFQVKEGIPKMRDILKICDVFVLNKEEAEYLVGKRPIKEMAEIIAKEGPKYVLITDGPRGAGCYHDKKFRFIFANNIKVVETTGAGDAFASSFISGLILFENHTEKALKTAMINAESVITHFGPKEKLLTRKELESRLKRKKYRVKRC